MSKICEISGKRLNNGNQVSHSNIKTKKIQNANIQKKRIWSPNRKCWIRMKISTKVIKSLNTVKI